MISDLPGYVHLSFLASAKTDGRVELTPDDMVAMRERARNFIAGYHGHFVFSSHIKVVSRGDSPRVVFEYVASTKRDGEEPISGIKLDGLADSVARFISGYLGHSVAVWSVNPQRDSQVPVL
jgi:hypothetical protein